MTPQGSPALLRDPQSLRDPQTWPFHPLRDACILLGTPGTAPPILSGPFHPLRDPQTRLLHLLGDQGPPFPHRSPEMAPPIPSGTPGHSTHPLRDPLSPQGTPRPPLHPLRDPNISRPPPHRQHLRLTWRQPAGRAVPTRGAGSRGR